jgi:GH25 family lysozyme M1 (1,4-beta-N-acetylmuramidase)
VNGVDVHGAKGDVNWRRVREAGFEFAFLKATEGRTFDDERFGFNRRAARAAGLAVGAYHFARPDNNSAESEAAHFLQVARPQRGDLLPVLDWEQNPPTAAWALRFLRAVEAAIRAAPILYSFPDFLRRTGSFEALRRFPLWYASYGPNDGQAHSTSPPASFRFAVHQFTSRGRVAGISGDVDLNLLKLETIRSLVYEPDASAWEGELEFHARGEVVSVGVLRDSEDRITPEATTWIRAVRAAGGRGRVTPHQTLETPEEAAQPEDDAELPPNAEGEGFVGAWSESGDRESLEQEDFSAQAPPPGSSYDTR